MSNVTKPIVLDETMQSIKELLEAHNHLVSHQNAAIDLLASDKRATLSTDVATVAVLAKNGELLEMMDYGDQLAPAWRFGETEYAPEMNLCHEADAELEDGETVHGVFFEWDKTIPTGMPFDAPEAIAYFDGTEGAGTHHIEIGLAYGGGWVAGDSIQFTLNVAPADGDQLVIALGTDPKSNPTDGRTWTLYAKGGTEVKDTGTTSNGTGGTSIGSTSTEVAQKTNGKINAPSRAVYGYNRWSQSGLRQWLNSTAPAGAWWAAQNPWDRPASQAATVDGFLSGYAEEVYRHFKPIRVVTVACNADDNVQDITYDRVFLSSLEQMYCVPQFAGVEGECWEYYKRLLGRTSPAPTGKTYARLKKYALNATTSAQHCFRRSALRTNASHVWSSTTSGFVTAASASYASRCAPGVFLSE